MSLNGEQVNRFSVLSEKTIVTKRSSEQESEFIWKLSVNEDTFIRDATAGRNRSLFEEHADKSL